MMVRSPPPGPVTLDSACDCDWSGACDPCKAHDFRRNGGAAYRLLAEDIEARALLARNVREVLYHLDWFETSAAHAQEYAAYLYDSAMNCMDRWMEETGAHVNPKEAIRTQQEAAEASARAADRMREGEDLRRWVRGALERLAQ